MVAARALALLALFFLLGAWAQAPQPFGVQLEAEPGRIEAEPGETVEFRITIRNTGSSPLPPEHNIDLNLTPPPEGWTASFSASSVAVPAGGSANVTLTVKVDEEAEDGVASLTVSAVVRESVPPAGAPSQFQPARDEVTVAVEVQGGLFSPLTRFLDDRLIWVVVGGIGVLIIVLVAVKTRKKHAVEVRCDNPRRRVNPGKAVNYSVAVENTGRVSDVISLTTAGSAKGWETYLSPAEVALDAGDEQFVVLSVKAPKKAKRGERAKVAVVATSGGDADARADVETVTAVVGKGEAVEAEEPAEEERSVLEAEEEGPLAVRPRTKGATAEEGPGDGGAVVVRRRREAWVEEAPGAAETFIAPKRPKA